MRQEIGIDIRQRRTWFLGLPFDGLYQRQVLHGLSSRTTDAPFGYVVTPNVQHVVMADGAPTVGPYFEGAWLSLCDSRPVRRLARWSGLDLPLVTGSDLTAALVGEVVHAGEEVAVVCASDALAAALRAQKPEVRWSIHVPPAGTQIGSPEFEACVQFVAEIQGRFAFVCLGAPKSEAICHSVANLPGTTGTALCTGASLEFMLGLKQRAPHIFQRLGLEWLHRMLSEPRRLTGRYVSAMLPLLRIWLREYLRRRR